jgi:hypothetical protein
MARWLILVHRIPPRPLYLRAKIRQRLAGVGAVAVKNAVYLLPRNSDALEDLQWIVQEITAGGGDAHVFEGDFVDGVANDAAVAQFREARDADYTALAADARAALKSARSLAAAGELTAAHAALTRRFDEIRRIDFFHAPARKSAASAIAAIAARLKNDERRMPKKKLALRGKLWVTRPDVGIDRLASAWFIRRFVDAKARFRFDAKAEPRDGEIRFDMAGGDFTHEGDRCTLETLVRRTGIVDKGVRVIAEIVHDIDLKETKFDHAESAGVRAMIDGLVSRVRDDAERVERGIEIFDDLHEALGRPKRSRK